MNAEIMLETARTTLDDLAEPYLWSNDELIGYANEGEGEACRRARLIVDSTTDEVTLVALEAGEATADLDDRILFIRRAKLAGRSQVLRRISVQDLDKQNPDWEDQTGEPSHYIPDMDDGKFRPWPTPEDDSTVRLTVVRLPLEDITEDTEPEIKARYHRALVSWMLYRAYSKQDAETKDETKAAVYLAEFEREFGKKSSAIDEVWLQREHDFMEAEGNF